MCTVRTCIVVSKVRTFLFSLLFVDQVCVVKEWHIRRMEVLNDQDIQIQGGLNAI
jgi:hypothetical protein